MRHGIISGALWGLDTVVLGIALSLAPFPGASGAPLAGALLHDVTSALVLLVHMGVRGRLRDTISALEQRGGRAVALGALLGGPVGMTGYLIAIGTIGPGYTAIITTFYPAFGTLLAFLVLKERMRARQIAALLVALAGVIVIGSSPGEARTHGSALLGIGAALVCVLGWGSEAVILAWGMRDEKVDNETALQIRQTTSGLVYLVLVGPLAGVLRLSLEAVRTPGVAVLVGAAVAGTASYLFYYRALGTIGASRGMALNISYSAWAVVLGIVLLGAVPSPLQVLCCIVILTGTVLAATPDWAELRPAQGLLPGILTGDSTAPARWTVRGSRPGRPKNGTAAGSDGGCEDDA